MNDRILLNAGPGRPRYAIVKIALISSVLVGLSFWLQGSINIGLSDEGYLWYGAIHTALGKVPIRDFQSYDPGRYYWAAIWSFLFGDGILALRLSTAVFQFIGLTLGLLAARRAVSSYWALALVGLLLVVWMYPRHKLFDISLSMAAVFFAVRLLERPTLWRHFSAGLFVGLAAFFGRNHGFYGFFAFFLLILFIWMRIYRADLAKRLFSWLGGIALGYFPMLVMVLFIPGFFDSFVDSVLFLFEQGTTNLPLPVPWPWRTDYSGMSPLDVLHKFFTGCWFLVMPIFYLFAGVSIFTVARENIRERTLLIASTFVGVFYMHYAFSRPDIAHLAHGVHPFLLGAVSLPAVFGFNRKKALAIATAVFLTLMTLFTMVLRTNYLAEYLLNRDMYAEYDVGGDTLLIDRRYAHIIDAIKRFEREKVGPGEGLFLAPYFPILYPILERDSPTWAIYFLFKTPLEEQEEMITALEEKNVRWAVVGDFALNNIEENRFRNTNALLWWYLLENFEPTYNYGLPVNYIFMKKVKTAEFIKE